MSHRLIAKWQSICRPPLGRGEAEVKGRGRSATLTVVTALGQVIAFLFVGILTRFYTGQDFALYGLLAALCTLYGAVSALKLDQFMIAHHRESDHVAPVAIVLTVSNGILFTGIFAFLSSALPVEGHRLTLVASAGASFILFGLIQIGYALRIRNQQFGPLAGERFVQIASTPILQVACSALPPTPLRLPGLIVGEAASRAGIFVSHWVVLRRFVTLTELRNGLSRLGTTVSTHRSFTLVLTVAALVSTLGQQLPMLTLPLFHSPTDIGQYYLWWRLITAPLAAIIAGSAPVFFSDMARAGEFVRTGIFVRTIWWTTSLSCAFFACLVLTPQHWFVAVLGEEWAKAVRFIDPIALGLVFWVPASATSASLVLADRQRETLWFAGGEVVLKAVAIVGLRDFDLVYTAYAVAAISVCLHAATVVRSSLATSTPLLRVAPVLCLTLLISSTLITFF